MTKGRRGGPARRIAVVGGGIAGLGAAYYLSPDHDVTLFEAEPRLGGHARTVMTGPTGDLPVDTGFIIFNEPNYPHLWRLFDELDIPRTPAEMSFSISLDNGGFEYALKPTGALRGFLAQPVNLLDPRYIRLLRDILRFNNRALSAAGDPSQSLGDLLAELGTGDWLRDRFLLPLTGAIWSMPTHKALDAPAQTLIRFLDNHALLSHRGHHRWFTVDGGAAVYVDRLTTVLHRRGVTLKPGHPVETLRRTTKGADLRVGGNWQGFDHVILAVHADQALALLDDPDDIERRALSAIRFEPNPAVLHSDTRAMPRRKAAWASWNFLGQTTGDTGPLSVTYCMNKLQIRIPPSAPMFVSLNPALPIRPDLVHDRVTFHHPIFDLASDRAKQDLARRNGDRATWYCGAWMRSGFHEDGIASAAAVARALG